MKPIEFKEQNKVYAKNQKTYLPLPVYEDNKQGGRVFHCWQLSFIERIKILFTGKMWVNVLHFKKPLQPLKLMVNNPFITGFWIRKTRRIKGILVPLEIRKKVFTEKEYRKLENLSKEDSGKEKLVTKEFIDKLKEEK